MKIRKVFLIPKDANKKLGKEKKDRRSKLSGTEKMKVTESAIVTELINSM